MTVVRLSLDSVVPVIMPFFKWKMPLQTDLFLGVKVHWAVSVPAEAPDGSLSGGVKTKPSPGEGRLRFPRGGISTNLNAAPLPGSTSLKVWSPPACWAEPAPGSRMTTATAAAAAGTESTTRRLMENLRRAEGWSVRR